MSKNSNPAVYVGGQILGEIPQNILKSNDLEIAPDGESIISHSGAASFFLEKNGFHKI